MRRKRVHKVDEVDNKIIAALRQDGRKSNVELGREIGVSEGTIRKRVARLIQEGVMQVIAVANPQKLGYQIEVMIGIHCDIEKVKEIADHLASLEEIRTTSIASGVYDIIMVALFRNNDELLDFLLNKLSNTPGIRKTETSYLLRTFKRTYDWPVFVAGTETGRAAATRSRRRQGARSKA